MVDFGWVRTTLQSAYFQLYLEHAVLRVDGLWQR